MQEPIMAKHERSQDMPTRITATTTNPSEARSKTPSSTSAPQQQQRLTPARTMPPPQATPSTTTITSETMTALRRAPLSSCKASYPRHRAAARERACPLHRSEHHHRAPHVVERLRPVRTTERPCGERVIRSVHSDHLRPRPAPMQM
jgi:hypothetical protein